MWLVLAITCFGERYGINSQVHFWNFQYLIPLPLVRPCSFYMYPYPLTNVWYGELPSPSQKTFRAVYEFSNENSRSEKRVKNYFLCELHIKDQCFYTVIYIQRQQKYSQVHKKMLNADKFLRLFYKKHLYKRVTRNFLGQGSFLGIGHSDKKSSLQHEK